MSISTLHYHLKKKDGLYVAKCVEIPAVMVYGTSQDEVASKLNRAIHSYLDAFPSEIPSLENQQFKELVISPI